MFLSWNQTAWWVMFPGHKKDWYLINAPKIFVELIKEQKKENSSEDRYQRPSTGEDQLANSESLLYLWTLIHNSPFLRLLSLFKYRLLYSSSIKIFFWEIFPDQARAHVPCIGRWIPNHWTTRGAWCTSIYLVKVDCQVKILCETLLF